MEGAEFLEYLELQGNLDLVTKSELVDAARRRGARVSDRQLTSYITEGLVPRSARIGSRSGAFPKVVVDVLVFIARARERGLSVEAVKDLLPLWRFLERSVREGRVDLAECELIVRQRVRRSDAMFSVPWVVQQVLPCPACQSAGLRDLKFVFKDGSTHTTEEADPLAIGFVMQREEPSADCPEPVAWMRVDLSPVGADDPSAIVMSIPTAHDSAEDEPAEPKRRRKVPALSGAPETN